MKNTDNLTLVKEKAQQWLEGSYDEKTKEQVKYLLQNDEKDLVESFYKDLEFGTGGLRGIMGVGTNRMNIYTVGMATQGLCNYLKQNFKDREQIKVAVAYDCRNNSPLFAETTANIFSANGIKAYLFESLRPTPELSFAIRHFGCQSGVVITASHNPKEYNGFKAYWDDGGQLINPHDVNVVEEARKITDINEVKFSGNNDLIEIIGNEIDELYLENVKSLSLSPEVIEQQKDMKIVYTPIHGTGVKLVPEILRKYGFTNIFNIKEQDKVDGNFPTVVSPNPEEPAALKMAIERAQEVDAEIVMATDPDADRVGIAVKDLNNNFTLLNGNQTAAILIYYLLRKWSENGKIKGKEYIIKTIVTTELLVDIAKKYKVEYFDTLTGFKFFADIMKKLEGKKTYIGGGEESYGYLAGEFVRDKDAVMACALIAEATAWAKNQGKKLIELLIEIYIEFGFYKENLISIVKKGKEGTEEIKKIMDNFRNNPPSHINNSKIVLIKDYLLQEEKDLNLNTSKAIELSKSNVLQFFLEDGSKISIRPSGTEPKIKFYFGVKEKLERKEDFETVNRILDEKIESVIKSLKLR
ncbi:MAG: phospho-sugar mutase [Bacteroidetes bacterium]|nr:phospho-sugar mutase [Bacteroidota bacterium]MBT6685952.1 phospho-sugar mutase [Bacteroidota bacterium]MBT7144448.1 phospho-sugar mutase [Bacteroidota bacterium]MBT7490833.1 phospho-sugar mutase [Bacteroidota bacterium]